MANPNCMLEACSQAEDAKGLFEALEAHIRMFGEPGVHECGHYCRHCGLTSYTDFPSKDLSESLKEVTLLFDDDTNCPSPLEEIYIDRIQEKLGEGL